MQQAHAYYISGDFPSARIALQQATLLDPSNTAVRLQRALLLDATGQYTDAREIYDQLSLSDTSAQVLIPSAINQVALARKVEASETFARIARSAYTPEDRDYARVWLTLLALSDRAEKRKAFAEKKSLETRRYIPIMDVITGIRETDDVAIAVKVMRFASEREQRVLTTEYYFFLGFIEQVRSNRDSAYRLQRLALSVADGSVERPLIIKSLDELRAPVTGTKQ